MTEAATLSQIDAASNRVLQEGMTDGDPVFVSTLRVGADRLTALHPKLVRDADGARVLRSVLMKPESEGYVDQLHERLERLART
ncbi:hypothetical protein GCM10009578_015030 [Streptomyces rhizosphaericus]